MAATRRLAAVLAADMVGYSRLMSFDEEGTLGRLGVLRAQLIDPKIAEHGGRLVKTTGDGLLVEFPSSIGALRCAIDMQAGVAERETGREDRRICFRIGIHQGDIIVDEADDIHGNGVNIAARLEGLADAGGICISDRVQEDAAGRVDAEFEDIGEQPLKNIERPPRRIFRVYPRTEGTAALDDEQPTTVAGPLHADASIPAAEAAPGSVLAGLGGLSDALPAVLGEIESSGFSDLFDVLAQRTVGMFAQAGAKYRAARTAQTAAHDDPPVRDQIAGALLALAGHAPPNASAETEALLHGSGFVAAGPRSAEALGALVSDWLGHTVEVAQFAGAWLALAEDQRSALPTATAPGAWNRLGVDAALGTRAWDPQARIVLRIGPLDRAAFDALLPDRPRMQRLVSLVRRFLPPAIGFAVNPVPAGSEAAALSLDAAAARAPRLGWNTWMPAPEPPAEITPPDATDAVFEAEIVEAAQRNTLAASPLRG